MILKCTTSTATIFLSSLLILMFSSCCSHDEPGLENLKVCNQSVGGDADPECDSHMDVIAITDPVTTSVLITGSTPETSVTFELVDEPTDIVVREDTRKVSSIPDIDGDECEIRLAISWAAPATGWPANAPGVIKVTLDNGATVSRTFRTGN